MKKPRNTGKSRLSPLKVDLTFDELLEKVAKVPHPRKQNRPTPSQRWQ